jgi:hypothetical protein
MLKELAEKEARTLIQRPSFNRPAPKKPRAGEVIGGRYIVVRRGRSTKRVRASMWPFEHPTLESAQAEAARLAQAFPDQTFVIFEQVLKVETLDAEG